MHYGQGLQQVSTPSFFNDPRHLVARQIRPSQTHLEFELIDFFYLMNFANCLPYFCLSHLQVQKVKPEKSDGILFSRKDISCEILKTVCLNFIWYGSAAALVRKRVNRVLFFKVKMCLSLAFGRQI